VRALSFFFRKAAMSEFAGIAVPYDSQIPTSARKKMSSFAKTTRSLIDIVKLSLFLIQARRKLIEIGEL